MTQKHTPGPWVGSRHPSDMRGHTVIRKADCTGLIGTVYHVQDAALIAAAPDLLAEAHTQLRWLRHIRPQITAPDSVMLGFDQAEKALSAAIAKAEGRS